MSQKEAAMADETVKRITAQEGSSLDIIHENLRIARQLCPEIFTEGGLDFEALRRMLKSHDVLDESKEKYGLHWHGKAQAMQLALTPSAATLLPSRKESCDWEKTQNIFIEGDNLEVLKLLLKSYTNKIKLVYIDPPYNTNGDFIYSDRYGESLDSYLAYSGQVDESGSKYTSNVETNGRRHTRWLNMIYPRLYLARRLLSQDGIIMVHIDEHEFTRLTLILDELFGLENNLGPIIWDKRNPKGDAKKISTQHEYIVLYAKNIEALADKSPLTRKKPNAVKMIRKADSLFKSEKNIDQANESYRNWLAVQKISGGERAYDKIDENGLVYQSVSMAWPNKKDAPDEYRMPLAHPKTGKACAIPEKGWRYTSKSMQELLDKNMILFGEDETTQPRRKYLLRENLEENIPSILPYAASDDALLQRLGIPFDHPKPVKFVKELLCYFLGDKNIVLDFFAGSGTTAHACMELNTEKGLQNRYILVQLPEKLLENKKEHEKARMFCKRESLPENIAEISKARIRRARNTIREENPDHTGDLGFKSFKLSSSNIKVWDPDPNSLEENLLNYKESLVENRSEEDVLYELLLMKGEKLTASIEAKTISGKKIYSVESGLIFACFDSKIGSADIEPIVYGIVDWMKDLNQDGKRGMPGTHVFFKDSAFHNDEIKINVTSLLSQCGIRHVSSL